MQGIKQFIPTEEKAEYINQLLRCGFDMIDFGSFVSPKAIPQMKDTADLLGMLDLKGNTSALLAIVANLRGATDACSFDEVDFLGFPFSISETFQQRNTNSSITDSLKTVEDIQDLCEANQKNLLVYISMAFGNPYGDEWNPEIAIKWGKTLKDMGIRYIALADTIGSSTPENIKHLFGSLIPELPGITLSAHLHSTKERSAEKISAAYESGCRSFDVAIHGFGGCPMAKDDLTGNIATESLEDFAISKGIALNLNREELQKAYAMSWKIFNNYH
jgi:hydroxymethylglutaryl-CoA lyase